MLILTRRVGETLMIGDEVSVTVLGVKGNQVRIVIDAPRGYCQVKRNQRHFVSQLVGRRTKNQQLTANSVTFVLLSEH